MINFLKSVSHGRWFWTLLLLSGVGLEACGLYFQYGLRLDPCVSCVYERAFYLSFILAGLIGFVGCSFFITRFLACTVFLAGSVGGVYISYLHLLDYMDTNVFKSCTLHANFPSYLPLDKYLPWMFQPSASCEPINWSLFGFTMPECIIFSFGVATFIALLLFIAQFFRTKRKDYFEYYK